METEQKTAANPINRDLLDAIDRLTSWVKWGVWVLLLIAFVLSGFPLAINLASSKVLYAIDKTNRPVASGPSKEIKAEKFSIEGSPELNGVCGNASLTQSGTLTHMPRDEP
jgi:hypothetical protein